MNTILLFLISALFVVEVIDALGTQVATYDTKKMLELIENLNGTVSEQLSLAAITWGKLKADFPNDVSKMDDLDGAVVRVLCRPERNITLRQQLQGYLIRENIREHLEVLNTTEIFQQALEAEDHEVGKWQLAIGRHSQRLHYLFKPEKLKQIMEKVIRKLYKLENAGQLASFCYQLYIAGNRDSYNCMVQTELMIYNRYKIFGKTSPDFSRYMAKLWQSLQMEEFYVGLDSPTKQGLLEAIIDLLGYL
ncbi:uncharacterized protein [Drosophila bipectinata]|uniref:uncharacterized protein n=1 Tax=Drosophila bipectinata TaxID=42026 RepID=UPI001C8A0BFE|nr:uncharacterized protein LOC108119925 [Drosophila bipectinata]KAH8262701.1 hypothetical protein KR026_007471 [Drosophila bipectinata]